MLGAGHAHTDTFALRDAMLQKEVCELVCVLLEFGVGQGLLCKAYSFGVRRDVNLTTKPLMDGETAQGNVGRIELVKRRRHRFGSAHGCKLCDCRLRRFACLSHERRPCVAPRAASALSEPRRGER